jgi:hypothetical protein
MGSKDSHVDIWAWHADWEADRSGYADVDTVYPNSAEDYYPFEQPGGGARPHATEQQPQEFLTGWAAGNLLSDPRRGLSASGLEASGFGTLTMRPRASQHVVARGEWCEGRWNVVLHRPLDTGGNGAALHAGDTLSLALALWDGALDDRDGQKSISIWQDLELER